MYALHQAHEIRTSILEYLRATFNFRDRKAVEAIDHFLEDPVDGMFKGPYVSLKLPYKKPPAYDKENTPLDILPDWTPYIHQLKSWQRLSATKQGKPQATIITTGTGSGKTEAFLYPILDYCHQKSNQQGIKAIILYPMNALATDQAKRLAKMIYDDERLKGNVTAGLFIGQGTEKQHFSSLMGPDNIIEDRNSILSSPPDILFTNFKMLDLGLMRSRFQPLWKHNKDLPSLLQYLVLDEIHTYDGPQGTDVAHLIRRLKLKLGLRQGHLCPVGTSATVGSGSESTEALAEYTSKLFGEKIDSDAILVEDRQRADDFFPFTDRKEFEDNAPGVNTLRKCHMALDHSRQHYLEAAKKALGIPEKADKVESGKLLKEKLFFYDLMRLCENGVKDVAEIIQEMNIRNEQFRHLPEWDKEGQFNPKKELIFALLSIVSHTRNDDALLSPLVQVQVQIWVRELRRVLRRLDDTIKFSWNSGNLEEVDSYALPPWFCRECGATGWLGMKADNRDRFSKDINAVYSAFFSHHKNLYFIVPRDQQAIDEYKPTDVIEENVHKLNLDFNKELQEDHMAIIAYRKINDKNKTDHVCPDCNSRNTVTIIGTRIPTLNSIVTSQNLSTDLSDTPVQERKLLCFTNGVQDAAHQAGFIESRNYNFTFRASLQKVINEVNLPVSLLDLNEEFLTYWQSRLEEDEFYWRFFPKDYINLASPDSYKTKKGYADAFKTEMRYRIQWQILSEFGYNSRIGRTLEKTMSSAVYFDYPLLEKVHDMMKPWMEANNLGAFSKDSFLGFLNMVLHRIRVRGGLDHPYLRKFREEHLKIWDLNWSRDKRHFLNPRYHPGKSRFPKLVTPGRESDNLLDSTYTNSNNWFHEYLDKYFQRTNRVQVNEFYEALLECLKEAKIMNRAIARQKENYALLPSAILVEKETAIYECNTCGHRSFNAERDQLAAGSKCLAYRCRGQYVLRKDTGAELNYYKKVYNRNLSPRIFSSEHTGLLDRARREQVERSFKSNDRPNSINALVATSTLEMGIDIGALDTAMNSSVPPGTSNFLQRVGRAGRSSGTALIINLAAGEDHDLHYFQSPRDMMEGSIQTPGCFLEAKEILKRHFLAYCIDSWTSDSPDNSIPNQIRDLSLLSVNLEAEEFFINGLIDFIQSQADRLLRDFIQAYEVNMMPEQLSYLKDYVHADHGLFSHIGLIFHRLQDHLVSNRNKRKELKDEMTQLGLAETDELKKQFDDQIKSLGRQNNNILKTNLIKYLTDVGALPNYAFPESGVNLEATVYPSRIEEAKEDQIRDISITRPSSQAIKELVPGNHFYSQGYSLKITGLRTTEWAQGKLLRELRFCSSCDHLSPEIASTKGENCPKCGDGSFGSASNQHSFAILADVISVNNQKDAKITDISDDRDTEIFNRTLHFNFDRSISRGAHIIKEIPFGIEFVSEVNIQEVNLGLLNANHSRQIKINGQEVPVHGFVTCKYCGKSSSSFSQERDYAFHYGYCKHRDKVYEGTKDDVFEEVFLMREFKTEVLKILIPVSDFDITADLEIFKAGIELGLQKYFGGNPSHIRMFNYSEYNKKSLRDDHFLLLTDTVPGGTSYLENISKSEVFSSILKSAFEVIRDCVCSLEQKDGCYRCIYSYSNKYVRSDLSRDRAENIFRELTQKLNGWEYDDQGFGTVINSGRLEESILEDRFVSWLKDTCEDHEHLSFLQNQNYDHFTYQMVIQLSDTQDYSLSIAPQKNLGPQQGVKYQTIPDFLIRVNSENLSAKVPEIAIYLDGYEYHATAKNMRFPSDYKKRMAIHHGTPHRISWTICWDDFVMDKNLDTQGDLLFEEYHSGKFSNTISQVQKMTGEKDFISFDHKNNLQRLLCILTNLHNFDRLRYSILTYLYGFQLTLFKPSFSEKDLEHQLFDPDLDAESYIKDEKTLRNGWSLFQGVSINSVYKSSSALGLIQNNIRSAIDIVHHDQDLIKEDWIYFWHIFNLLNLYSIEEYILSEQSEDQLDKEFLDCYPAEYHPLLIKMHEKGAFKADDDSEDKLNVLVDQNGNEVAGAGLILHSLKTVFAPHSDEESEVFRNHGYFIDDIKNFKVDQL